jgi:hypothetical protein
MGEIGEKFKEMTDLLFVHRSRVTCHFPSVRPALLLDTNDGGRRKFAAEQKLSESEALKVGMEQKSREFVEKGAEVYAKA